jgi:hypothetical protein
VACNKVDEGEQLESGNFPFPLYIWPLGNVKFNFTMDKFDPLCNLNDEKVFQISTSLHTHPDMNFFMFLYYFLMVSGV